MPKGETKGAGRNRVPDASMVLLTGPSAAGKSSLALALAREGWDHLDGDAVAKALYVPGSALLAKMARIFGKEILGSDGSLDAQRLGEIVFPSPARRKALNKLVYPAFQRALRSGIRRARAAGKRVVADVPVYFDMGAPDLGMPVVLVDAPMALRIRRLRRLGVAPARAKARAAALSFGPRQQRRADLVLDGSLPKRTVLARLKRFLEP